MTRDEIRALIGGYATGSLTESEKSALFAAALEDQELFDELANEQALKNVIDEPGARDRLIRSLEPVRNVAWRQRPWPWVTAATVAAAVIAMFLLRPAPKTTEVARLETPAVQPPVGKTVPQAENAPASPRVAPRALRKISPPQGESRAQLQAPGPPPAPVQVSPQLAAPASPPANGVIGGVRPPLASAPMAARRDFEPRTAKDATNAVPLAAPKPQAAPAEAAKASSAAISGSLTAPFGIHYTVDWTAGASITADAAGYLTVFAESKNSRTTIFPLTQVIAGSTTRVPIPAGSDAIVIQFTGAPPDASLDSSPLTQTTNTTGQVAAADTKLRVRISK